MPFVQCLWLEVFVEKTLRQLIECAASVAQWFSAVDFRRRRLRIAVGSSPIHGRLHAVQRP